jgi:hypothetical protein
LIPTNRRFGLTNRLWFVVQRIPWQHEEHQPAAVVVVQVRASITAEIGLGRGM